MEDWAARGLAPAPIRRSLGRGRGMASEYPSGAVDQYAAVAAVMRRGRPWQISVIKLLARGRLPTNEDLVRQALGELLAPPGQPARVGEDALGYAERVATEAAAAPVARLFLRAYERNLRRSPQILEPGTEIRGVITSVVATLTLIRTGQPVWTDEALGELLAAHGIPIAGLTGAERAGLSRFAEVFATEVIAVHHLARVAAQTPLHQIQAAIPQARTDAQDALAAVSNLPRPSEDMIDILTVFRALIQIQIDDLGGDSALVDLAKASTATLGEA